MLSLIARRAHPRRGHRFTTRRPPRPSRLTWRAGTPRAKGARHVSPMEFARPDLCLLVAARPRVAHGARRAGPADGGGAWTAARRGPHRGLLHRLRADPGRPRRWRSAAAVHRARSGLRGARARPGRRAARAKRARPGRLHALGRWHEWRGHRVHARRQAPAPGVDHARWQRATRRLARADVAELVVRD
jgi:hypothetical protein